MKILHINALDSRYGCSVRARAIRDLLRGAGHHLLYAEPGCGSACGADFSIPARGGVGGWAAVASLFAGLARNESYDVLFVSKPIPPNIPAMLAARQKGAAILLDCDDLDFEFQSARPLRLAALAAMKQGCRLADAIITHNGRLAQAIRRIAGCQAQIIPQGVDTELFNPALYDRDAARRRLGLEGKKVFGLVATMTSGGARAFPAMLEALSQALKGRDDAVLMVVGGGPLLKRMRRIAAGTVGPKARFEGMVGHEEVPAYIAAMDIALLYMLDDDADAARSSMKLLEYLAMGVPVVARLTGHCAEAYAELCLSCADAPSFVQACRRCLEAPPPRGQHAEHIRERFSWKTLSPMFQEALERAAQARRSRTAGR